MSRQVHVDFYRVTIEPARVTTFGEILRTVEGYTERKKNWPARDEHVLRLHKTYFMKSGRAIGNMVRLRMTDVPRIGSIGGSLQSIDLEQDEGVAEETAFLYSPEFDVIALQRNRYGATPNAIAAYFKYMTGTAIDYIYLEPILEPDAVLRMERMVQIRKVQIRAAGITSSDVFGNRRQEYGVKAMSEVMKHFEAPVINMELSVGRQRTATLAIDRVRETLQRCLGIHRENPEMVRGLRVHGNHEDGTPDIFDMLNLQMTDSAAVKSRGRSIDLQDRISLLQNVFLSKRSDLREMFEVP